MFLSIFTFTQHICQTGQSRLNFSICAVYCTPVVSACEERDTTRFNVNVGSSTLCLDQHPSVLLLPSARLGVPTTSVVYNPTFDVLLQSGPPGSSIRKSDIVAGDLLCLKPFDIKVAITTRLS